MFFKLLFLIVFIPFKVLGVGDVSPSYLKEALEFQNTSLKKSEALQQEKEFQDFRRELQHKSACNPFPSFQEIGPMVAGDLRDQHLIESKGVLTIFVSFSCTEKALLNLANEAQQYGARLVLRGFREESYAKTVKALQKITTQTSQGFLIDPDLFTLFSVTATPTFILTKPFRLQAQERIQTPLHDRLQGHVSIKYALEIFAQGGDHKEEAQSLLKAGQTK